VFTIATAKFVHVARTNDKVAVDVGSNLEDCVVLQSGTKLLERLKAQIWITRDGWSVLIAIDWPGRDNGKGIVRRSDTSCLHISTQYVIDKRRFSRGVVADQQDKRQGCPSIGMWGQRTVELVWCEKATRRRWLKAEIN